MGVTYVKAVGILNPLVHLSVVNPILQDVILRQKTGPGGMQEGSKI